ncbi:MAG: MarR family transcriptional regulator [Burkholderiales bacterium]|nr:MAG: MarR family transcriptional regulator [Burkholderiales bacterium]
MSRISTRVSGPTDPVGTDDSVQASESSAAAIEALQNFRIIFRSVRRHFHEVEERCGISGSQLWALSVVAGSPGIRVKDLARSMAVQQSTASNLVEQLSRQGLVRRARENADQRIVQLYPTRAGQEAIDRAPKPLTGLLPDVLSRLDSRRLATLNRLLQEIVQSMRLEDSPARHTPLADL